MRFFSKCSAFIAIAFAFLSPFVAQASSFSSVVVFGDSLSDNGNLYAATGYPPPPYYQGRFSDGKVAVEQLAGLLGVGLSDFAWGGATTGLGNIVDNGTQTSLGYAHLPGISAVFSGVYGLAPHPGTADPNALYVVWGGANDFEASGDPTVAATNIANLVALLQADGAQHILVPGLPNLSLTPEFQGVAAAANYTSTFNAALLARLGGNAIYFDTDALLNSIVNSPASYGFTDVTHSCLASGVSCSQSLFFDDIHPTTATDAILARQFAAVVVPTPEPSAFWLVATGLTGAGGVLFRRRRLA